MLVVYADDVTIVVSHEKTKEAGEGAQIYVDKVVEWIKENLLLLADKNQASLFTPDPSEVNYQLTINIDGEPVETSKHPEVLGLTFDQKLNFNEHVKKVKNTLKLVKAITGTNWGQQKEIVANTYKQYTRPVIEYACPAWAPIISSTNCTKLQTIQNAALRCSTGRCTGHLQTG